MINAKINETDHEEWTVSKGSIFKEAEMMEKQFLKQFETQVEQREKIKKENRTLVKPGPALGPGFNGQGMDMNALASTFNLQKKLGNNM